ncbi:hypothetical protein [Rubrobacter indicoceani]|uniref:hypothetical protein n=1 Tax=Rubrobacter indicoceani TaxID=2051957 RepID=UPI000E5BEA73|nr:hypothetical protein [Rubrobacter indicoceani]
MISSPPDVPEEAGEPAGPQKALFAKSLSTRFRESWKRFASSRPGQRFQDRYSYRKSLRRKRARRLVRSSWLRKFDLARIFYLGGGIILICLSAVGGWLPVLGWGTVFLGLGMIAGEFRPAARFMDWAEKRGRKAFRPVWHLYLLLPRWLQFVLPLLIALGTFALMVMVFRATFAGG